MKWGYRRERLGGAKWDLQFYISKTDAKFRQTLDLESGSILIESDQGDRKIYLNPALPKDWNCEFKLYGPYNTVLEGKTVNGKVAEFKVRPESRRADVVGRLILIE